MRRPPDRDGHSAMTERDVITSNATLNAFFGGSRQKSWMLAGGAPVRPTPRRPSITNPSDQNSPNAQRYVILNSLAQKLPYNGHGRPYRVITAHKEVHRCRGISRGFQCQKLALWAKHPGPGYKYCLRPRYACFYQAYITNLHWMIRD